MLLTYGVAGVVVYGGVRCVDSTAGAAGVASDVVVVDAGVVFDVGYVVVGVGVCCAIVRCC